MEKIEEKDQKIIQKVLKYFKLPYLTHHYFYDGTDSKVLLLNDSYLIKQNKKKNLKAEVEFLRKTRHEKLQKILYIDKSYEFVVYKFIPGETMKKVEDVPDTLKNIVSIVSCYSDCFKKGYGFLYNTVDSWSTFLENQVASSSPTVKEYISENALVSMAVSNLKNYPFEKKLLHGDFGTHNFIKQNKKLVGVIDPLPIIGDPLYDILFAVTSNAELLKQLPLSSLYEFISEPKEKIQHLLLIILYIRISRCLKYHPNDILFYLKYWNQLKQNYIETLQISR